MTPAVAIVKMRMRCSGCHHRWIITYNPSTDDAAELIGYLQKGVRCPNCQSTGGHRTGVSRKAAVST